MAKPPKLGPVLGVEHRDGTITDLEIHEEILGESLAEYLPPHKRPKVDPEKPEGE